MSNASMVMWPQLGRNLAATASCNAAYIGWFLCREPAAGEEPPSGGTSESGMTSLEVDR